MPRPRVKVSNDGCGATMVGLLLSVPLGVYRAWVFMLLWGWFVVPALNVPAVGFWMAYGLMTFVSFAVASYNSADFVADQDLSGGERTFYLCLHSVAASSVALAIGWVVHVIVG